MLNQVQHDKIILHKVIENQLNKITLTGSTSSNK